MDGIIIRLPYKNMLLYKKNENLYLGNVDRSQSKIILSGCSDHYDAVTNSDGQIFIVCSNENDVFLYALFGDDMDTQRLELPPDSTNFRLHIVNDKILCLGFTAPIGGGRLGLYHTLPQTGKNGEFIGRCAVSSRPYCSAVDQYGNVVYVYATHDGCINIIEYIWSKKEFDKGYCIGTHQYMASSPHILIDGDKVHCTYISRDDDNMSIMYYNSTISTTEVIYVGCYTGALPILIRINEQIHIMWNQYGRILTADAWQKKVSEVEDKKFFSDPSYVGIRLPMEIIQSYCSEAYARDTHEGFRLLSVGDILKADLLGITKTKIQRLGEDVEKLVEKNSFEKTPEKSEEIINPLEIEIKKLSIRVKMLENDVKTTISNVDGLLKLLSDNNLKQEVKPRGRRKAKVAGVEEMIIENKEE